MITIKEVRLDVGIEFTAIFLRNPRMPDGYIVGQVFSDDPELAARLRDTIDNWGGSWTVEVGKDLPDWMEQPFLPEEMFKEMVGGRIAERFCYVSNEKFAFGDDIPVLIVDDIYFELKPVE